MGDRTALQAVIHDAHPDELGAIFDALIEYRLLEDKPDAEFELGDTLLYPEILCGSAEELADRLLKEAPRTVFTIWEDPQYEWLGSVFIRHPGVQAEGMFSAECDAEGQARFTAADFWHFMEGDESPAVRTGTAWTDVIDQMTAGTTVVRPPACDDCGEGVTKDECAPSCGAHVLHRTCSPGGCSGCADEWTEAAADAAGDLAYDRMREARL